MKRFTLNFFFLAAAMQVFAGGVSFKAALVTGEERVFNLSGFSTISNDSFVEVVTQVGEDWSIRAVSNNGELLTRLRLSVEGENLRIRFSVSMSVERGDWVRVHVTMPKLNAVALSGSGNFTVESPFSADRFTLFHAGSGNFSAEGNFAALQIDIAGRGDVAITGHAESVLISSAGAGSILPGLSATSAALNTAGSGTITLDVSASLTYNLAGSGNVFMSGDGSASGTSVGAGTLVRL